MKILLFPPHIVTDIVYRFYRLPILLARKILFLVNGSYDKTDGDEVVIKFRFYIINV